MQLQDAKQRFEKQGIKLAAISYDSSAILKDFTERHRIQYPLLADPDSQIIRSFNVLNAEATGQEKGMAHPGFFYIDSDGVIREKYFEVNYVNRFTPNNIITKLFPELTEEVTANVEAPHLRLTLEQSDRKVAPGSRVTLIAQIELPSDVHVYAPGVQGYKPIQLTLQGSSGSYPGTRAGFRGKVSHHARCYGPVFSHARRPTRRLFLGEDYFDYRRIEISGLRRQGLLSTRIGARNVELPGDASRPQAIS